jgi:hypothetical protein
MNLIYIDHHVRAAGGWQYWNTRVYGWPNAYRGDRGFRLFWN